MDCYVNPVSPVDVSARNYVETELNHYVGKVILKKCAKSVYHVAIRQITTKTNTMIA